MPAVALAPLTPYLSLAAVGWLAYRRMRRSFGRQPFQPLRAGLRMGVMGLLALALAFAVLGLPAVRVGIGLGALAGVVLGVAAMRHTRCEWEAGQGWSTTHPWIGATLVAVLLARLAWRLGSGAFGGGIAAAGNQLSPLTMGIASALVVYTLWHGTGVWWRLRQLRASAALAPPSSLS